MEVVEVSADVVILVGLALLFASGLALLLVGRGPEKREALVPFGLAFVAVALVVFTG